MKIDEIMRILREKFGEPDMDDYDGEDDENYVYDEEELEILHELEQMTEEDLEFSEMEPLALTDFLKYFSDKEATEAAAKEAAKATIEPELEREAV